MSRIAKAPITVASGIEVKVDGQHVTAKGSKGTLEMSVHPDVSVQFEDGVLGVRPNEETKESWAHAGTLSSTRSLKASRSKHLPTQK